MSYARALDAAWRAFEGIAGGRIFTSEYLGECFEISPASRSVLSAPQGVPAKDHTSIILLHYLAAKYSPAGLPPTAGKWADFRELPGGEGYYPAFRKRTIDVLALKFSGDPKSVQRRAERLGGVPSAGGDAAVIIRPVPETALLLSVSEADDEFGPDANILFDGNIGRIFCTEDVVVMTETVVRIL